MLKLPFNLLDMIPLDCNQQLRFWVLVTEIYTSQYIKQNQNHIILCLLNVGRYYK